MMNEIKCNKLLNEIADGSDDALSELYSEMNKAVFTYALSIARNKQLAEDITQDVFVKIKFGAKKYVSNINPNGWILRLTRNTAFDSLKMQKHELPSDFSQDEQSNDFDQDKISNRILLKDAMEKLSSNERQVVLLYLVAGVSQKEIASVLKLPVTAVNWYYRAGIKKLSASLKVGGYING